MTLPRASEESAPLPASKHRGHAGGRSFDAVSMLTVYLVLLFGVPSSVTIAALGSLGRPSLLWGLFMLAWWLLSRLQIRQPDVRPVPQPVRFAYAALLVIALVSLAAALLRGQPADQVSPALTAVVRLLSWGGVLLVTIDGVRTHRGVIRIVRRIGIGAGLIAALGVVQFLTGQPIIDFFGLIPGLSGAEFGIAARGGVLRAPGPAIHPLEFATALNAALPLVIAAAISHGFHSDRRRGGLLWWLPVALISVCALVGVSRSAIIGFAVASITMIPVLPRRYRAAVIVGGAMLAAALVVAVPGLLRTTLTLFTGASDDPSTQSRTAALERAPEFISNSPLLGIGFGTFLPRYYIFDNQWVLVAVELGILGVAAFAGLFVAAIVSAAGARRRSADPEVRLISYALAAAMVNIAVLFAFFDGLSFPMSGGMLALLAGLCGAVRTVAAAEAPRRSQRRRRPLAPDAVTPGRPPATPDHGAAAVAPGA